MSENIWIHCIKVCIGFISTSIFTFLSIFTGLKKKIFPNEYRVTHEIITTGPESFVQKPTAIKLGRALFVPFILISQLYERK